MSGPVTIDTDPLDAMRAALLASAPVSALAGTRIFAGELPNDEVKQMPRECVVIQPSGGTALLGGSFIAHDAQRIDVLCYAATPNLAAGLLRTVTRALRNIRREVHAGVLVHWVDSAGGFSGARDPDTQWPRAFQSVQIFYALDGAH